MERTITIENDVPIIETRGRPVSEEYIALVKMKPMESFTSHKSRDSLYQIARNLNKRVTILWAGPDDGWRVFYKGERGTSESPELKQKLHAIALKRRRAKRLKI